MKTYHYFLFIILLLGFTYQSYSQSLQYKIDNLLNKYALDHQFMGSVLVADKGKVVFKKGYGLANAEQIIPNTPDTKFRIGSITKQFTAMIVIQLVERGKLRLDNKISEFLPFFPKNTGDKITIEMLLSHTSGLPLPEGIENYYHIIKKEDFIKQVSLEGLHFEPGEKYKYSNTGYKILGMIVEKVTGKTYEEVLNEQILKPLGMSNTGCDKRGLALENRAYSYIKLPDEYVMGDMQSFDTGIIFFGSGFMYSTVKDLFLFSKAFSTNKLLTKKYMDMYLKMRTVKSRPPIPNIPEKLVADFFGTCGNGFVGEISAKVDDSNKNATTLYWHDGTMNLFKAFHYHFSGKEQYIIILSNCSLLGEGDEMALKIYQLLNNKPYENIRIKCSLLQYVEEEVAMYAGIPAAFGEYLRFKNDTLNFLVPDAEDIINIGRQVAERGDLDDAIDIFQFITSEFPESWKAYNALGETYIMRGDTIPAIQSFKKSLELNPQNTNTIEILKKLGNK